MLLKVNFNKVFPGISVWIEHQISGVNILCESGGRLNKKDGLTRYGNSHVKDKTS